MNPKSDPESRLQYQLVEISRVVIIGGVITELGGPAWRAYEDECRRWFRTGTRFFMYDEAGNPLDVYLDERGFLTTQPTWRTSGDGPIRRALFGLPRMVSDADLPVALAS